MYQSITIIGNLGKNPDMRYTPNGQAVTTFNVATSRPFTNANGQKVKETCWFRVSMWGKQGEICNEYLKKGSRVMVEGRLVPDPETGGPRIFAKADGTSGASFEVTGTRVVFLSAAEADQGNTAQDAGDVAF